MALAARDEPELRSLASALAERGHRATLIIEEDEPYKGQAMAIGIAPGDRRKLKRVLSRLPLLK